MAKAKSGLHKSVETREISKKGLVVDGVPCNCAHSTDVHPYARLKQATRWVVVNMSMALGSKRCLPFVSVQMHDMYLGNIAGRAFYRDCTHQCEEEAQAYLLGSTILK